MSNQEHMTIEEAVRFLQDGAQKERLDLRMFRAAQTIVIQDDKITRLQNALNEIEEWGMNVLETLVGVGIIHQEDMQ
jgi:hypothetical protein